MATTIQNKLILITLILSLSIVFIGCGYSKNSIGESQRNSTSVSAPDPDYSDDISFSTFNLSSSKRATIKDLHNGNEVEIVEETKINGIVDFILTISGNNRTSSKGWYGGIYEVLLYDGNNLIFGIGFGDDESFNYGANENDKKPDGSPYLNRYSLQQPAKADIQDFFAGFFDK